jgi:tripartite-type tricarboxylate transporter receptor subunit TctC
MDRRHTLALAISSLALGMGGAARAQAWPSKPIRIILPFPAGSGTDSSARFIGDAISRKTGQPVIVDNRPGANGLIEPPRFSRRLVGLSQTATSVA